MCLLTIRRCEDMLAAWRIGAEHCRALLPFSPTQDLTVISLLCTKGRCPLQVIDSHSQIGERVEEIDLVGLLARQKEQKRTCRMGLLTRAPD